MEPASNGSGFRKAAVLMVALGEEIASSLLREFSEDEIRTIGGEITRLGTIPPEEMEEVLHECHEILRRRRENLAGGLDYAEKLVSRSVSAPQAERLLGHLRGVHSAEEGKVALSRLPPRRAAQLLASENPRVLSVLLGGLEARTAATILALLPEDLQNRVVARMARTTELTSSVVGRVTSDVHRRLEEGGAEPLSGAEPFDGVGAAVGIVKLLGENRSERILGALKAEDPELAAKLKELMFTFEDLLRVDDRGLAELLRNVETKPLAISLKGATEELVGRFLKNMSARARDMLKDEMEFLGPLKLKEIEAAQKEVLEAALRLRDDGTLTIEVEGIEVDGEDG